MLTVFLWAPLTVATIAVTFVSAFAASTHIDDIANQSWDYVIVGGGLAGLVVASRLNKRNSTVLVIEAGLDNRSDPAVFEVGKYGRSIGTDLEWVYKTTKQDILGGQTRTLRGGKTLGGSTSINGAAWNRGHKSQYDSLAKLTGDKSYDFKTLQRYMNKAERFVPPNDAQRDLGADYDSSAHGTSGPLQITFTSTRQQRRMYTGPQQNAFLGSISSVLSVPKLVDQCNGNNTGAAYTPNSINTHEKRVASYDYLQGTTDKLHILFGYRGVNIAWTNKNGTANGVHVQKHKNGKWHLVHAKREVIVAAGAINSPAILERSGIGAKDVISALHIDQVVDLPGVGKNLQEQTMSTMGGRANVNFHGRGPSNMIAMPSAYQLMPNATHVRKYIRDNMDQWATILEKQGHVVSAEAVKVQWETVENDMFDNGVPISELFFDTGYPSDSYGIDTWFLLPFSRGSTHASTMDVFDMPRLDPNYFAIPIDMDFQVASLRANRRIFQSSPLHDQLDGDETQPGFHHIPDTADHGDYKRWRDWILGLDGTGGFGTVSHQIATCAMAPRNKGGVVDGDFKVYGTNNVRVVDASVLPVLISAHLSSTLYGFAEKAADAIRPK